MPSSGEYRRPFLYWSFYIEGHFILIWLPWWLSKEICLYCRRPRSDSWVGKIPWRSKWQPTWVFLPWEIPWTEDFPCRGGLQSMGLQRVGHGCTTNTCTLIRKHSSWLWPGLMWWWLWIWREVGGFEMYFGDRFNRAYWWIRYERWGKERIRWFLAWATVNHSAVYQEWKN